ncbi:hypothetical protein SCHPADRAFT_529781 [Schizopora paradoxa]|uniref:Uncharacterized protein n=1 Tax=Schizopora paradoxa TaxID=27342 RepID=A0A0H2RZH7_9AGAM|nr:hypothetical protein SCHPADRAFT_529781 [Schizopora paradoxa]
MTSEEFALIDHARYHTKCGLRAATATAQRANIFLQARGSPLSRELGCIKTSSSENPVGKTDGRGKLPSPVLSVIKVHLTLLCDTKEATTYEERGREKAAVEYLEAHREVDHTGKYPSSRYAAEMRAPATMLEKSGMVDLQWNGNLKRRRDGGKSHRLPVCAKRVRTRGPARQRGDADVRLTMEHKLAAFEVSNVEKGTEERLDVSRET